MKTNFSGEATSVIDGRVNGHSEASGMAEQAEMAIDGGEIAMVVQNGTTGEYGMNEKGAGVGEKTYRRNLSGSN